MVHRPNNEFHFSKVSELQGLFKELSRMINCLNITKKAKSLYIYIYICR